MPRPIERKFGEIPESVKTEPITLRNYNYRAEWHASIQSAKRNGVHPTISIGSPEFAVWFQYFERHLGGFPWAMRALLERRTNGMTVPELRPEWFDPSFEPVAGYQVRLPREHEAPNDPRMAGRFDALLRHFGASKQATASRKSFRRYTDDELASRYQPPPAPQQGEAAG